MSESRDELVARRDALIEQLQGEWKLDRSWASVDRKLWPACLVWIVSAAVCFYIPMGIVVFFVPVKGKGPLEIQFLLLLLGLGIGLGIAIVLYLLVHGHQLILRRCSDFVVADAELVRDCGKGYPTQSVNLHQLRIVIRPGQTGAVNGEFMYEIMRAVGIRSLDRSAWHMLGSKGESGTPAVRPILVHEGDRFAKLLTQLAETNTRLEKLL